MIRDLFKTSNLPEDNNVGQEIEGKEIRDGYELLSEFKKLPLSLQVRYLDDWDTSFYDSLLTNGHLLSLFVELLDDKKRAPFLKSLDKAYLKKLASQGAAFGLLLHVLPENARLGFLNWLFYRPNFLT